MTKRIHTESGLTTRCRRKEGHLPAAVRITGTPTLTTWTGLSPSGFIPNATAAAILTNTYSVRITISLRFETTGLTEGSTVVTRRTDKTAIVIVKT